MEIANFLHIRKMIINNIFGNQVFACFESNRPLIKSLIIIILKIFVLQFLKCEGVSLVLSQINSLLKP